MRNTFFAVVIIAMLAIACVPIPKARAQPLQTWDALPAFDPMHLSGAHAGRRVCPMCTHGYDAGVMLFLPTVAIPADIAAWVSPMVALRHEIQSARFRVFIILVGATPSDIFLETLKHRHPNWYVAHLSGGELAAAERNFGVGLDSTSAYVFAQRRLLRRYTGSELPGATSRLTQDANYALRLLDWLHPIALPADAGHDTPQGELWLAPSRLHAELKLTNAPPAPACFVADDGRPLALALLALRAAEAHSRPRWARTDAQGCVSLGLAAGRYQITLYELGQDRLSRELLRADPTDTPVVVGDCEGCDAAYDGRPVHLSANVQLAADDEPGERLRLHGRVYRADGKPAAGVQIYAYQTNQAGLYPPLEGVGAAASRHGKLRGWVASDGKGHYRFDSIRPGSYPDSAVPQHIHLHVIEPGRCTYFLDDVVFADDPLVNSELNQKPARGGSGLTQPERNADGSWVVRRDIYLGRDVPDYANCGDAAPPKRSQ